MMKSLPIGYQVVAGLAIVYALFTGGCMCYMFLDSPHSQVKLEEILLDGLWASKSLALLVAGCLLAYAIMTESAARRVTVIRAAQLAFVATALACVLQAIALIHITQSAFGPHGGEQGPLVIFFTVPMFVMAALWMVITSVTALKLGRHRRRAQQVANYQEQLVSLPTEALTTALASGALDAEARDLVDQILRDRLKPPAPIDTRFQTEQSHATERPRD